MASCVEENVELKSPAEKFFRCLSKEIHHLPNASDTVHGVEVHEGDFETHGSIKLWSYTIDGKKEIYKEKVKIDEANMTVSLVGIEGDVLEKYKSYKSVFKVIPKDGKPAVLNVKSMCEKFKETDPDPNNYLSFLVSIMKDLDAHLVAGQ